MLFLRSSLAAWQTTQAEDFISEIKKELTEIDKDLLPLQQGLRHSSYANGDNLSVSILNVDDQENKLMVKAGLFYTGIIAGCNCADDPTPVDENNEYCEVLICIDKETAATNIAITD